MSLSTVSGILTRIGLGKLGRLGLEPAQRYERARPGELIHIDIKKLGRIQRRRWHAGSPGRPRRAAANPQRRRGVRRQTVGLGVRPHRIDDATRLAYVEVLPDEKAPPPSDSSDAPSRSRPPTASPPSGDDRQRQRLPLHSPRHRLPRPRNPPPTHPPLPTPDQRQGLCLRLPLPSDGTARLPAPAGLTQAKGMPGRFGSVSSDRSTPPSGSWPAFDLSTSGMRRAGKLT